MLSDMSKKGLLDELLCIADSEWALGHWYIKLVRNGRTITDFSSIAALAQDELGHARAMFRFLEDHFEIPEYELEFSRDASQVHSMELLDDPPESWGDMVLSCLLAETALECQAGSFEGGALDVVSSMLSRFSEENYFHRLYLQGWLGELSETERMDFRSALEAKLPMVGAWLGTPSAGEEKLLEEGVRVRPSSQAREAFIEGLEQRLSGEIDVDASQLANWVNPNAPESWDGHRRRTLGSALPPSLFEFMVPTSAEAQLARRPLRISVEDNIDLVKVPTRDETDPVF